MTKLIYLMSNRAKMENHICHTSQLTYFQCVILTKFRVRRLWSWIVDFSHHSFHSPSSFWDWKVQPTFFILPWAWDSGYDIECQWNLEGSSEVPAISQMVSQLGSKVAGMWVYRGNCGARLKNPVLVPSLMVKKHLWQWLW